MEYWEKHQKDLLPLPYSRFRVDFKVKISGLKDPKRIAKGVSHNNWFIITINEANEIPYALSLIRQAYERS